MFNIPTNKLDLGNGNYTQYYDSGGNGEIVILLHGLALSLEIWGKVIDKFDDKFRVLAFDFPGSGRANKPNDLYNSDFFGQQIITFMDRLNIEKAHLIGSSLGASAVVRLAKTHQHRMNKIVIMAPGGFGQDCNLVMRVSTIPLIGYFLSTPSYSSNLFSMQMSMYDKKNASSELIELITNYSKDCGYHPALYRSIKSGLGPFGVKNIESFRECARNIEKDCLIIWGKQDKIFPAKQAPIANELIKNSKLIIFDKCGHYPHWEQPDMFSENISKFLNHS